MLPDQKTKVSCETTDSAVDPDVLPKQARAPVVRSNGPIVGINAEPIKTRTTH